jgi:hypothetical protein
MSMVAKVQSPGNATNLNIFPEQQLPFEEAKRALE